MSRPSVGYEKRAKLFLYGSRSSKEPTSPRDPDLQPQPGVPQTGNSVNRSDPTNTLSQLPEVASILLQRNRDKTSSRPYTLIGHYPARHTAMKISAPLLSLVSLLVGCTAINALPAPQAASDSSGTCINQSSGNIYIDFENIDVEKGSSFMVRIGSLNTGNIASAFGGASSVKVDQTSGDIYVTFDNIDVSPGGRVRLNIGSINTGNVAITKAKAKQLRLPAKPSFTKVKPSRTSTSDAPAETW